MTSPNVDQPLDEVERYELREARRYAFLSDRREFLETLGAGWLIAVAARDVSAQRSQRRSARRDERLSERFHIGESGAITVLTSKVEVGQGARTQIAQAVAEEFQLPVEQIRVIMADTGQCPDDGGTAGSRTTPATVPRVRQAAAAAREALLDYAAERLGVDRSQLSISDGTFRAGERQVTLAEMVKGGELPARLDTRSLTDGIEITPVANWRVLGQSVPKVTGRDAVTGAARYPSDITRPGMVYGKIVRPVSYGATLTSVDLAPAQAMDGVSVVHDGDFLGCTAPTSWQAAKARDAIAAATVWERPAHPSSSELFAYLKQRANDGRDGDRADQSWDALESALQRSAKAVSAEYLVSYIQHAPMEPRAAVAEWDNGKLTVWTGSQQPSRVRSELCDAFRLNEADVRVIVPDTGGGFGGKHTGEAAVEAARLAKAAGRPVHLRWTREEEFTWAYFRPAGVIEIRAGVDAAGRILGFGLVNYNSGRSAIESPYAIPVRPTRFLSTESPLRQGSYRALASTANTFARESEMDELANLAGADPLEFRLRHLEHERLRNVLHAAAERFDWQRRWNEQVPDRGVGLACGTEKGSYVAACAAVRIRDQEIQVEQVCMAFECGAIQNPANLRAQVEGCLIMGLGGALWEEIEFAQGQITSASFSAYRVPRMSDLPALEIVLLDRPDLPSVGAGETPIIAVAPAIANAVHRATGVRCRTLPLGIA